jgi:hypothetical protein
MNISRDDAVLRSPVYVADEVNTDTQTLIKRYLETVSEPTNHQKPTSISELPGDVPHPLFREDRMNAQTNTNLIMLLYFLILAVVLAVVIGGFVMYFWVAA